MKLSISKVDKWIGIDEEFLFFKEDFSWIPDDVKIVHWDGERGEVEYIDTRPNLVIEELGIYEQAIGKFNDEVKRIEQEKIDEENSKDYWQIFRDIRNYRLGLSDWTQISDNNLSEELGELWRVYRSELRDLPLIIQDPKPLVLDEFHPDWPIPPG